MSPENEVDALQASLMTAVWTGDRETCERIFGEQCSLTRATRDRTVDVVLRDCWLDEIGAGHGGSGTVDDRVVSVHGNLAIATVLWTVAQPDGERLRHTLTDVWKKNASGEWQLIERHGA